MALRILIATNALVFGSGALLLNLLTVVPIPVYRLWPFSLGAIELSLWFGVVGLVGALLGVAALRMGSTTSGTLALVCGLLALGIGLIPPLRARTTAAQQGVHLSLVRYFFGWSRTVAPVEVQRDIVYNESGGQTMRLDLYQATNPAPGPHPAMVVVHGGSWNAGAKGEFSNWSRAMVGEGLVVFDIDYRLAGPDQHFPVQVGDVKCAIGWIKQHAQQYQVDPDRIVLVGRSAGGQIALSTAYSAGNPALQPACQTGDTSVRAVIALYAPVDLVWGYTHPAKPDLIEGPAKLRNYLGGTPDDLPDIYRLASPLTQVTSETPPTLIIHGGHDRLVGVQHATFLRDALQNAGVPNRLVILPWADHGFDFFYDGWGSQIVQPIMRDFLATNLNGQSANGVARP